MKARDCPPGLARRLLAIALIPVLAACSPAGRDGVLKVAGLTPVRIGENMAQMRVLAGADTRRMVLRIPDRGLAVTLLPAGSRDGVLRWRGTDNAQIHTKDGMIIATRGFGDDLMTVDAADLTRLIAGGTPGRASRIHRRLDGEDRMRIEAWICDVTPEGRENVRTGETRHTLLLRVSEKCYGPRGDFTNTHWIGAAGIVQSRQFVQSRPPARGPGPAENHPPAKNHPSGENDPPAESHPPAENHLPAESPPVAEHHGIATAMTGMAELLFLP